MRWVHGVAAAVLLASQTGCGTVFNLWAPPQGGPSIGPSSCLPMGGVMRSGGLALLGPFVGVSATIMSPVSSPLAFASGNFKDGLYVAVAGPAILAASAVAIVDTPLSLAADIVTLPIAIARNQERPWATWWGSRSIELVPTSEQPKEDDPKEKSEGEPNTD